MTNVRNALHYVKYFFLPRRDGGDEFLERVKANNGWEDHLSEDLTFSNFAHPVRRTTGKRASLEGIRRFYAMANTLEIDSVPYPKPASPTT